MSTIARHREVLARTPGTLDCLLRDLPDHWTRVNEGDETWSPFDVVGHLVHGEHTDWISRVQCVLDHGSGRAFEPFDRFAQFDDSAGKSMNTLLDEFARARAENLTVLTGLGLKDADLDRPGRHPEFGAVTLGQLLATWVVHDLGHVAQITRIMAKQYAEDVGPWRTYLRVVRS